MKNSIESRFDKAQAKLPANRRAISLEQAIKDKATKGDKSKLYWTLRTAQNSICPICKEELLMYRKDSHIDHDHITNKTRGLLCQSCNVGLGCFKDNQKRLEAAWNYLEKNKQELNQAKQMVILYKNNEYTLEYTLNKLMELGFNPYWAKRFIETTNYLKYLKE